MGPDSNNDLPPEPSVEETWEALRRRAYRARLRSSQLRQEFRATVQESDERREHDRAVENAIARAAHEGDLAARDTLVRRYAPLMSALARNRSEGSSARHARLTGAGISSLLTAIEGWDPAADVTFRDYAVPRADAAIQLAAT
jgi:DNA-directed RNA polymerase sigma subunit (sigma70/sigma32)